MNQNDSKPQMKPTTKTMVGNMQTSFSKKISKLDKYKELMDKLEKEKQLQEIKKIKEEAEQTLDAKEIQKEIAQYETKQLEIETISSRKPSFKRVKSFKEMDITEKLAYLLHFPKQLPPVPCIVSTKTDNYRGFVLQLDGGYVELRLMDQTITSIKLSTVQDVKMIGI
ncbi:CotO family spore coat protein [Bacillus sp. B1-b2]|uniref:CotO family spore coat protein n=1 Tax=Bacillus sp. B1-b2 TaxID=2653201 RepID=UPI0012628CE8|nr:CotO family spore coat protein [Bacillus sp. B1-b2]KAB7667572.1 hypothetical protein F9279_15030 [Bacillus sp. B1-b2]